MMLKELFYNLMGCVVAFLLILTLYVAFPALADKEPELIQTRKACNKYLFCDAQTATGVCTVSPASGDEQVLQVAGNSSLTFYSVRSVGAHICNVISNDVGFDASTASFQINAASLTEAAPILSFNGNFDYIWVTCPTIGTDVTVTGLVCPGNN